MGPVSMPNKMYQRKISWSIEAVVLIDGMIALDVDRRIIANEVPVKCKSDQTIQNTQLAAGDFAR